MFLSILLQFFPLGLTGMINHDPPYWVPGPRNIICLQTVSSRDCTYVTPKKNCGIERKFIIEDKDFSKLNLQNPFCVDSLEYW